MTFYLKYRPKNLKELDLRDVGESLEKILNSENIPHAFLFAGPKGTGKTSAARILAKIVNCTDKDKPCDKCDQCLSIAKGNNLDVIEMDAASNRGIDDVRNLKESIKLSPTSAKKKIYIIDEAHMLTIEASNALLKTLEEPPDHVIFILATTNPEKLIDTIRSRATLINFRKATTEEIIHSLKRIVDGEKIKIDEKDLEKIASRARGAFRDGVKLLEQVSMEGVEILSKEDSNLDKFLEYLYKKDREKSLNFIKEVVSSGQNLEVVIKNTLDQLQKDIMEGRTEIIPLIELIITANSQMKDSPIEELPFQIAIVKWTKGQVSKDPEEIVIDEEIIENVIADSGISQVEAGPPVNFDNEIVWKEILNKVKPINATMEALLRSSKPLSYEGNTLTLGVYYKFHKERLEDASHRKVLEDVVTKVLNNETHINCTLMEAPIIAPLTEDKDQDIIKVAEEIFS